MVPFQSIGNMNKFEINQISLKLNFPKQKNADPAISYELKTVTESFILKMPCVC